MREFVSAGGELMIHAALHPKNSPNPEINHNFIKMELSSRCGLRTLGFGFCVNRPRRRPCSRPRKS